MFFSRIENKNPGRSIWPRRSAKIIMVEIESIHATHITSKNRLGQTNGNSPVERGNAKNRHLADAQNAVCVVVIFRHEFK